MKVWWLSLLLIAGLVSTACSGGQKPVDVPMEGRVERKDWKDMTKEEKIDFIRTTPMPADAQEREIARIQAGTY